MKNLLLALSLVLAFALGFCCASIQHSAQSTRDYEAACLLMDCLRNMMDSEEIGSEVEESYYEWFQDLDMGIYNTEELKDIRDLEDYYWCY
jgi:hypothetical protein